MSSVHEDPPQAGPLADAVDLAGIGDGVLECRVDSPLKENDGTKDAYISYLVTTHVGYFLSHQGGLCPFAGCLAGDACE
jgi:sorting nexin-4